MAKKTYSKNFEKVKKFYDSSLWSKKRVYDAVSNPTASPWITQDEYKEITGEEYAAEEG